MAGGFGAEGEDGAAEFVADGDGEFFFCYGVGGYWGEAVEGWLVLRELGSGRWEWKAYLGPAKYSWRSGGVCQCLLVVVIEELRRRIPVPQIPTKAGCTLTCPSINCSGGAGTSCSILTSSLP